MHSLTPLLLTVTLLLLPFLPPSLSSESFPPDYSAFVANGTWPPRPPDGVPLLTTWLVHDPTLTSPIRVQSANVFTDAGLPAESEGEVAVVNNCFYKLKRFTKFIHADRYTQKSRSDSLSKFYIRCVRGLPYSEYLLTVGGPSSPSVVSDYMSSMSSSASSMEPYFSLQMASLWDASTGTYVIPSIESDHPPTELSGKGNFYMTSIQHLEHYAEQVSYLVGRRGAGDAVTGEGG